MKASILFLHLLSVSSVTLSCPTLWWHGLQHARLPCPSPRACWNSCSLSQWCHPTISSSVIPFSSCLQSFPALGSFLMSQFFTSGGQSIGVLASILPMNIQDWFPLGLTGLISLKFMRLSRVYQYHSSKAWIPRRSSFLYGPPLTSIPDYWKNQSFDSMDLCWQSNVSAFSYAVGLPWWLRR